MSTIREVLIYVHYTAVLVVEIWYQLKILSFMGSLITTNCANLAVNINIVSGVMMCRKKLVHINQFIATIYGFSLQLQFIVP